jgi:hypothetical protein
MKKLIILVCLVALGAAAHAQAGYQTFVADTVKGAQTHYITSTVNCSYNGFATFDFTLDGFNTDSCTVTLQGKNQNTTWLTVGTQIQPYKSTTATSYQLIANPATYLNYRLKVEGKATDTVRLYNPLFIYKR